MSLRHLNPGDNFIMDQTFAFFHNKAGGIVDGLNECLHYRESPGCVGVQPPHPFEAMDRAAKGEADAFTITQKIDSTLKARWNAPSEKPSLYPMLANADLHLTFTRIVDGQTYIQGSLIRRPGEGISCALSFVATERGLQVWHAMESQNPNADPSHLNVLQTALTELKQIRPAMTRPSPSIRLN